MAPLLLMLVLAATQAESEQMVLRIGTTAPIRGTSARVAFVQVSDDSRCPVGVNCFWEGDATVHLRVERDGESPVELQLHANPRFSQDGRAGAVTVTLLALEPTPQADKPIAADGYSATLRITSK